MRAAWLCFVFVLLLRPSLFSAFDFTWQSQSPGLWRFSGANNWLNYNVSFPLQNEQNWPLESPGVGDRVLLTLDQQQDVSLTGQEFCNILYVGSTATPNSGANQRLSVQGTLKVGTANFAPRCVLTRVRGVGLSVGQVIAPNYVFLETKESDSQARYGSDSYGSPGRGGYFTWELRLSNLQGKYYTPDEFNYTITDLQDGAYVVTYYAQPVVAGINLLEVYCIEGNVPLLLNNGQPYQVDFEQVVPPQAVNFTFSSSGTQILVNFTQQTDRLGLNGHFDCALIVDQTALTPAAPLAQWLGDGGLCYWRSDSLLVVHLGNNALPVVGDRMGIRGGIYGKPPNNVFPSTPAAGVLSAPLDFDAPQPGVSVARQLSACRSNVTLDTLGSYGTNGRHWQQLRWQLVAGAPNAAAIGALLDAASSAGNATQLTLPAGLFAPDVDYTVRLDVVNAMQQSGNASATFRRLPDDVVELNIVGNDVISVNYAAELALTALVSNPCNLSVAAFSFVWTGDNNQTRSYLVESKTLTTAKNLWIAAGTLDPLASEPYLFRLTYNYVLADGSNLTATATKTVLVDSYAELIARIQGPLVVDKSVDFQLDPTYSVDRSGSRSPFVYTWNCVAQTPPLTGRPCIRKQAAIFGAATRLTFSANTFLPGRYLFSLVVSKDNFTRADATTLLLTVIDTDDAGVPAPTCVADYTAAAAFSVDEPLLLSGTVAGNFDNWTWAVNPPVADLSLAGGAVYSPYQFAVIVPGGTFDWGIDYEFELRACSVGGCGVGLLSLQATLPPTSGRCTAAAVNLTSAAPLALYTYAVSCSEWETGRGYNVRTFDFGYVSPLSGRDVIVSVNPGTVGSMTYSVPRGTEQLLVFVRWLDSRRRLVIDVQTPPLEVVVDPDSQIDPIIVDWVLPYAAFGSEEDTVHAILSALHWLNYQGELVNSTAGTRTVLWNLPLTFTDATLETAFRRSRHDAADAVNRLSQPAVTRYSASTLAELYAQITTPTSATDQALVYASQRYPFRYMDWLPLVRSDDDTVTAFIQGVWNQLVAQQYFFYSPGALVPLAQAVTDLLNYLHQGMPHGMIAGQPDRLVQWRDVAVLMRVQPFDAFVAAPSLVLANVSVDLGEEVPARYRSAVVGPTGTFDASWGVVVLNQNPFIYEQSSEGIDSPVLFVNLINPFTSDRISIAGLDDPVRYVLPAQPIYNPYRRALIAGADPQCVWWDADRQLWSTEDTDWTDVVLVTNTSNVTLASEQCVSYHLTEFARRVQLAPIDSNPPMRSSDVGWWIFAGVLGFLLVLIVILAAVLGRRKLKGDSEEEEAFVNPNVVGVVRDDVE